MSFIAEVERHKNTRKHQKLSENNEQPFKMGNSTRSFIKQYGLSLHDRGQTIKS